MPCCEVSGGCFQWLSTRGRRSAAGVPPWHEGLAASKDWALKRYEGLPVPEWWKTESAEAYRSMTMRDSDVIMASYQKTGTTWLHHILYCLLRMDDEGNFSRDPKTDIGGNSQLYPDALPMEKPEEPNPHWGFATIADLFAQADPRLISSHLPAQWQPEQGLHQRGRFVYVTRNPKDTMTSMHFFVQKMAVTVQPSAIPRAEEGWMGDLEKKTLGTLGRWNAWPPEHCPEAYGSYYEHVRNMGNLIDRIGPERATVVYYERLHEDFDGEVQRLARFFGMPLSQQKLNAIAKNTNMEGLRARGAKDFTFRNGAVGEHKQYMSPDNWAQVDKWFEERLGDVKIAQPLRKWM